MEDLEYRVLDGADRMSAGDVMRLLKQTPWAAGRPREQVAAAMRNSRCYGVTLKKERTLVGFARVISDFSTTYYLCDLVIDADHRGRGLGKALVSYIESQPVYRGLRGMLIARDGQDFYEDFGYGTPEGQLLVKGPEC